MRRDPSMMTRERHVREEGNRLHRAAGCERRALDRRQSRQHVGELPDGRPAQENLGNQIESLHVEGGRRPVPGRRAHLVRPGTDSGTFDYFTDAIVGEEGASRGDYTASEDDNVTVRGVAGEKGALGYLGLSYLEENRKNLKAVEIDGGDGCVAPSIGTVQDGTYKPLSRPLFVYIKTKSLARIEVETFAAYLLDNAESLARGALFVPLTQDQPKRYSVLDGLLRRMSSPDFPHAFTSKVPTCHRPSRRSQRPTSLEGARMRRFSTGLRSCGHGRGPRRAALAAAASASTGRTDISGRSRQTARARSPRMSRLPPNGSSGATRAHR